MANTANKSSSNIPAQTIAPNAVPFTVSWRGKHIFPGINKTKGVCGGSARLGNTRIPVWLVISLRNQGASIEKILKFYPHLFVSDIASAENYYLYNKEEIDAEIEKNHRQS